MNIELQVEKVNLGILATDSIKFLRAGKPCLILKKLVIKNITH